MALKTPVVVMQQAKKTTSRKKKTLGFLSNALTQVLNNAAYILVLVLLFWISYDYDQNLKTSILTKWMEQLPQKVPFLKPVVTFIAARVATFMGACMVAWGAFCFGTSEDRTMWAVIAMAVTLLLPETKPLNYAVMSVATAAASTTVGAYKACLLVIGYLVSYSFSQESDPSPANVTQKSA